MPAEASTTRRPVAVEPVKETFAIPGCAAMAAAGGGAEPGDDVHHPGREADLGDELGEAQAGQRRELGRLHHDGVAGREGRAELPPAEHQREVPRDDLADDADRPAEHVVQEPGVHGDDRALHLVGHAGEVAERGGCPGDVEDGGVAERVAGVGGLQAGELVGVVLDGVRQPVEQPAAARRRDPGPAGEGLACRADRPLDIARPRGGDLRDHLAGVRVEHGEGRAVDGVDELAPDEQLRLHRG